MRLELREVEREKIFEQHFRALNITGNKRNLTSKIQPQSHKALPIDFRNPVLT
jgi:hypothetical protein